ncbi:MAG: DUF5076 domain-containing protein [Pseudomonadota bacterium]
MFGKQPFFKATMAKDGGMEVRIDVDQIESPEHAGIALADFLGHFSNAFAYAGKAESVEDARLRILELFLAELESPTDTAEGEMQE